MKDKLKIIIPLLLAVVIGLCYYKFPMPLKEELEQLQREEAQLRQEYEVNQERIQSIPNLRTKIEETEAALTALSKKFYDNWDQEEYIMRLREFGKESKVNMLAIDYSDDSVLEVEYMAPINDSQNNAADNDGLDDSNDNNGELGEDASFDQMQRSLEIANKTSYTIDFKGSYSQLKALMQLIDYDQEVEGYNDTGKFIVCDQLTVKAASSGSNSRSAAASSSSRINSIIDGMNQSQLPGNIVELPTQGIDLYPIIIDLTDLIDLNDLLDWNDLLNGTPSGGSITESSSRAITAVPASTRTASSSTTASGGTLECTIEIGFYYLEGFESYNLHVDYVNLLKERGLNKIGDKSPFKGVN